MKIKKFVYLLMGLLFLASLYPIKVLSSPRRDLVGTLQQQSGGTARISYHAETGLVRFIGVDPEHAIAQPRQLERQATPEEAAQVFLSQYGTLFGVSNPAEELTVMKSAEFEGGRSMVRYQQVYKGIPVFGGELIVNMDASKKVLSANGEILPGIGVSTVPRLDARQPRGLPSRQLPSPTLSTPTACRPQTPSCGFSIRRCWAARGRASPRWCGAWK